MITYFVIALIFYLILSFFLACYSFSGIEVGDQQENDIRAMSLLWPLFIFILILNKLEINFYVSIMRPLLFLLPPEIAHNVGNYSLKICHKLSLLWILR